MLAVPTLNLKPFVIRNFEDTEMRPVDTGDGHSECPATPGGGDDVCTTLTFSVDLPVASSSSVDFGLLVDVSASYRYTASCQSNHATNPKYTRTSMYVVP